MIENSLKKNKTLYKNLKSIKGISDKWALKICNNIGVNREIKLKELSIEKRNKLSSILTTLKKTSKTNNKTNETDYKKKLIDRDVDITEKENIKTLINLNTYRGRRIKYGYPAHGQRTWSNGKTAKKLGKKYKNI